MVQYSWLTTAGCLGQDTGPLEHSYANAATIATICAIVVPKYNNAGAASRVREDAFRHGSKSGCQHGNHGGWFKALELAAHCARLLSLLLPCHFCHCWAGGKLTSKGATTTPRGEREQPPGRRWPRSWQWTLTTINLHHLAPPQCS